MKSAKEWSATLATPSGGVGAASMKRLVDGIRSEVVEAYAEWLLGDGRRMAAHRIRHWWKIAQEQEANRAAAALKEIGDE